LFPSLLRREHTDYVCVCVCVRKRIPEHSPPKTPQNHVCTSQREREEEREGGRERKKYDKELDRKREEEERGWGGGWREGRLRRRKERIPYATVVAMATCPTIHSVSATVSCRNQVN